MGVGLLQKVHLFPFPPLSFLDSFLTVSLYSSLNVSSRLIYLRILGKSPHSEEGVGEKETEKICKEKREGDREKESILKSFFFAAMHKLNCWHWRQYKTTVCLWKSKQSNTSPPPPSYTKPIPCHSSYYLPRRKIVITESSDSAAKMEREAEQSGRVLDCVYSCMAK